MIASPDATGYGRTLGKDHSAVPRKLVRAQRHHGPVGHEGLRTAAAPPFLAPGAGLGVVVYEIRGACTCVLTIVDRSAQVAHPLSS